MKSWGADRTCLQSRSASAILMPGEPEESIRRRRLREGIPVSEDDLRALSGLGESMGLEAPF